MKLNRSLIFAFVILVLACSLYRVWDGRPYGFAPQIAMAIFAGAIIRNKKFSFLLPVISMLFSDALYQVLYLNGLTVIQGFYDGQVINYILFTAMTVFGFFIRSFNPLPILFSSLAAPTVYFLLSNFQVWLSPYGYQRPKTFQGLMMCYADGLPFYYGSLAATVVFSILFFGGYYLLRRQTVSKTSLAIH